MNIINVLESLRPNAEFTVIDNDIKQITCHTTGVTIPTAKQINDEIKRMEAKVVSDTTAKEDAKASAIAKLEALGLNLAEAQAILG
jgi:hypothetical protein